MWLIGKRPVAAVIAGGGFAVALALATPARSADQPVHHAAAAVPDGYVLVDQDGLRRLVHDEVTHQLQDIFRRARIEQQNREAAARVLATPQFANTLSLQIALYRLQHNDDILTLDQVGDGFSFLTIRTDVNGKPSEDPNAFGPYLQHVAVNAATGKSKVVSPANVTAEAGWCYEPKTGVVKAILPKQLQSEFKEMNDRRNIVFVDAK